MKAYRPNGRVNISDVFFCIHTQVMVDQYGNIDVMDECQSQEDWVLYKTDPSDYPGIPVCVCNDVLKWYRLSENCRVRIDSITTESRSDTDHFVTDITIPELQTAIIDHSEMPDQAFCFGSIFVSNGEITQIDVCYAMENTY